MISLADLASGLTPICKLQLTAMIMCIERIMHMPKEIYVRIAKCLCYRRIRVKHHLQDVLEAIDAYASNSEFQILDKSYVRGLGQRLVSFAEHALNYENVIKFMFATHKIKCDYSKREHAITIPTYGDMFIGFVNNNKFKIIKSEMNGNRLAHRVRNMALLACSPNVEALASHSDVLSYLKSLERSEINLLCPYECPYPTRVTCFTSYIITIEVTEPFDELELMYTILSIDLNKNKEDMGTNFRGIRYRDGIAAQLQSI